MEGYVHRRRPRRAAGRHELAHHLEVLGLCCVEPLHRVELERAQLQQKCVLPAGAGVSVRVLHELDLTGCEHQKSMAANSRNSSRRVESIGLRNRVKQASALRRICLAGAV